MDRRLTMQIKPLTPPDKTVWLPLWQSYLDFYQSKLSQATTDTTWQRITDATSPIVGFGVWLKIDGQDKMVGFVHCILHPNTWHTTDCCYLEDLYVNETARGKGVGRALIEQVYDFAKTNNCNRVYWVTQENNHTARKLYDTLASLTDFVQYRKMLL